MGHTFIHHVYHIVFSTKRRHPYLRPQIRKRMCDYVRGIAAKKKANILALNAVDDHMHICVELRPDANVSVFVRDLKGNSSKWASENIPELQSFAWQSGYSSFTVSQSRVDKITGYIQNQEQRHRRMSFREELKELLEKHKIAFDPEHFLD